jgi:hypothetical protein
VGVAVSGGTALIGSVDQKNYSDGIAYVYARSGSVWQMQATLAAPAGHRYLYGEFVALSGSTAVLSALGLKSAGHVYLYERTAGRWRRVDTFVDPGDYTFDEFGSAVAASGPMVVVGAPGAIEGDEEGAFYVYARSRSGWLRQAAITNPRGSYGAFTGSAVGISGPVAIVGAEDAGAAEIYGRSGTGWHRQAKLFDPDGASYFNDFGVSAAVSGATAMVGANYWDSDAGRVYVYIRHGERWARQAALTGKGKAAAGDFGDSVAIWGRTALIGAPGTEVGSTGQYSGVVYVYQRAGIAWRLQSTIPDPAAATGGGFGSAVALSGTTALIGADNGQGGGQAFVFTESGTRWHLAAKLADPDGKYYDDFGSTVAISGRTAVVGANGVREFHGAAYVYSGAGATWRRQANLTDPHGVPDANFGWAVSASGTGTGTLILVTELYVSGLATGPRECGNAFEYAGKDDQWHEYARVKDPGCRSYDDFGYSAALSGRTALIGAPGDNSNSGTAYVLNLP